MGINTQFLGNVQGILFITGADTENLPAVRLKPVDKVSSATG